MTPALLATLGVEQNMRIVRHLAEAGGTMTYTELCNASRLRPDVVSARLDELAALGIASHDTEHRPVVCTLNSDLLRTVGQTLLGVAARAQRRAATETKAPG